MNHYQVGEELYDFSLLSDGGNHKKIKLGDTTLDDLGLEILFETEMEEKKERDFILEALRQLTCDKEDIVYRQDIFEDLYNNERIVSELSSALIPLETLSEFQKFRTVSSDSNRDLWSLINYLRELNVYIEAIETLRNALVCDIKSDGLSNLKNIINGIYNDSGFELLKTDIVNITDDISKIKSLTLGVNLDEDLNPTEVILTSINEKKVASDISIISGFMEFVRSSAALNTGDFEMVHGMKKGALTERDSIMLDLTQNIEKALKGIIKKMQKTLDKYVNTKGYQILNIVPELKMYIRFVELFKKLEGAGFCVCKPQIVDDDIVDLKNLYNIRLAYNMLDCKEEMTYNDISFDKTHNIFILTGPNRGGKTILTQAVGQAVLFMILGAYVPGSYMRCNVIDGIFTHFPADENDTLSYGRLGEESIRIRGIVENIDSRCIVLLNETYATTSFSDGHFMARDLVKFLKHENIKCIYNTHIHELASEVDTLNKYDGDASVASLVMGIEEGKRSYKAQIREPDNNSFANDIARKYGVTYEQMIKTRN